MVTSWHLCQTPHVYYLLIVMVTLSLHSLHFETGPERCSSLSEVTQTFSLLVPPLTQAKLSRASPPFQWQTVYLLKRAQMSYPQDGYSGIHRQPVTSTVLPVDKTNLVS